MTKNIFKLISMTLVFCMLISTLAFAEESGTIKNMTYEEWLVEQEGVDSAVAAQSELEPVKVTSQKQEQESKLPNANSVGKSGNRLLDSILQEKGNYTLNENINKDLKAETLTGSIKSEMDVSKEEETVSAIDSTSEKSLNEVENL